MMDPPDRSPERDAAITALLAQVPELGWTRTALRASLSETGSHPDDAEYLFTGGAAELVEAFCDLADRTMVETPVADLRLAARVRALIAARLAQNRPHKEAIRRALAVLARPGNAGTAARCTARTVDAIWHAAGDASADFAWYTKRASLATVYAATVLYWLRDDSDDDLASLEFLDRRLADLGRVGKLRRRLSGFLPRLNAGSVETH